MKELDNIRHKVCNSIIYPINSNKVSNKVSNNNVWNNIYNNIIYNVSDIVIKNKINNKPINSQTKRNYIKKIKIIIIYITIKFY